MKILNFFILPDIGIVIADFGKNLEEIDDKRNLIRKEEAIKDYSVKAQRIHTENQFASRHIVCLK